MRLKNLAAKLIFSGGLLYSGLSNAGIPVIDGANLTQGTFNVTENVAQTLKQIQEYQTQLQQYQNMLDNSLVAASSIWPDIQGTIQNLRQANNSLNQYINQAGSIAAYLNQFGDIEEYENHPCFVSSGCTDAQRNQLIQANRNLSKSQKQGNDAFFKSLKEQQDSIDNDASELQVLQSVANGATGQMEALGYGNQLAGNIAAQLVKIRDLTVAQGSSIAAYNQAMATEKAQEDASETALRRDSFVQSPARSW